MTVTYSRNKFRKVWGRCVLQNVRNLRILGHYRTQKDFFDNIANQTNLTVWLLPDPILFVLPFFLSTHNVLFLLFN